MSGYFSINRDLINHELWLSESFSRGQAWVDLIGLAQWHESQIRIAGQKITIKRGQCGWSELKLSQRWKWSRDKTRRFLVELKRDNRILMEPNTRTTIITICNYDKYQNIVDYDNTTEHTTEPTSDNTTEKHQKNIYNKNNKENKEKESIPLPPFIPQELWNDFLEVRKKLKAVNSDRAISNLISEAIKLHQQGQDLSAVINQSITRSWKTLYPLKFDTPPNFNLSLPFAKPQKKGVTML